jgi:hypothetical protein
MHQIGAATHPILAFTVLRRALSCAFWLFRVWVKVSLNDWIFYGATGARFVASGAVVNRSAAGRGRVVHVLHLFRTQVSAKACLASWRRRRMATHPPAPNHQHGIQSCLRLKIRLPHPPGSARRNQSLLSLRSPCRRSVFPPGLLGGSLDVTTAHFYEGVGHDCAPRRGVGVSVLVSVRSFRADDPPEAV